MTGKHRAIVITDFWAGIIGTLLTTCIIGGVTYSISAYSAQAVTQEKVQRLEEANLPTRLDKLEEKLSATNDSVNRVESEQKELRDELNRKLDLIIRKQKDE